MHPGCAVVCGTPVCLQELLAVLAIDPLIRHHFYHFKNCFSVAVKDGGNLKHPQLIPLL